MCISGGKSNFSYAIPACPPRGSAGWSPMTRALSTTSVPDAKCAPPWRIKSAPLSRSKALAQQAAQQAARAHNRLNALYPPRPPMPLLKRERMRPSAGERFCRALAVLIAAWGEEDSALPFFHRMELLAESDWSSATFVGVRARITLSYAPAPVEAQARLAAYLAAADYALGTYLVADLTTQERTGGMMVEVLLLEVH